MKFATRLKELMEDFGITQAQLARNIDFSQRTVSMWLLEQTEPRQTALVKLSNYFNVSIDYLVGNDENSERFNQPFSSVEDEFLNKFSKLDYGSKQKVLGYIQALSED